MINVTMTKEQWIAVINMLAEQPFKHSANLIITIQNQMMEQDTMPPGAMMSRANGTTEAIPGQE